MKIEKLLVQKGSEIEHLDTPNLRANELLKILQIEYNNNKNINLLSSANHGLIEMLDGMNKSEILTELDFSIKILTGFQETGNFDLLAIPNNIASKDLSDAFESIKSLLINIITNKSISK